jgi:hypothetical protein
LTKRITLDETVVAESYMMRDNTSIGEEALARAPLLRIRNRSHR